MSKPAGPKLGDRVRNGNDGQLGFLVEHEGRIAVRLDRRETTILPYSEHAWLPDKEARLTTAHVARIAYEADRGLLEAKGTYGVKGWRELTENVRLDWIRGLPEDARKDSDRAKLWKAVTGALT